MRFRPARGRGRLKLRCAYGLGDCGTNGRLLRLGVVGCGRIVERGYVPALERIPGLQLVAAADPDRARCRRAAPGVPAHRDVADLVATGTSDALIVATPASLHLAAARAAAGAGLPALVEKPPAVDAAEAEAIAALDPAPWIGFNRRFHVGIPDLRTQIDHEQDFDIELEMRYRRRSWRSIVVSDDALLDLGPHLVDLVRWLTGAEVLRARAGSLTHKRAVFDLDLGRGRARIACATDRPYRERIGIRQQGGGRIVRRNKGALRRVAPPLARRREHPLVDGLVLQLEAFARAIRGEREPHPATAQDGLAVMLVIDAVRRSAATGGAWHSVPEASPGA